MAVDIVNKTNKIMELIEQGYADHQTYKDRWILEYRTFHLTLSNISDRFVEELAGDNSISSLLTYFSDNGGLKFNSRLECSFFICNQISSKYDKSRFEQKTSDLLNGYFKDNNPSSDLDVNSESDELLSFSVVSMSPIKELYPEPPEIPFSWIIGSIASTIFILILWAIVYYFDVIKKEIDRRRTIFIRNPMVIPIAIGFYKKDPTADDIKSIGGKLNDLDGVRLDLKNAINLFGKDTLQYDIYPKIYQDQHVGNFKAYWDEQELIDFMKQKSEDLENNLVRFEETSTNRYDGLLVIISCHGLEGCILTSDYQKIEKLAIHRIFTGKKPLCRKIPRIFLFDCCSESGERDCDWRGHVSDEEISSSEEEEEEKYDGKGIKNKKTKKLTRTLAADKSKQTDSNTEHGKHVVPMPTDTEQGKNTSVTDIIRAETEIWMYGEDNPDARLVTINAANHGFQSKMSIETGSYVITKFVEGIRNNLNGVHGIDRLKQNIYRKQNDKFMYEILNKIQEDLHDKQGKQLMVYTFNNKTEFIKFEKKNHHKLEILIDEETKKDDIDMIDGNRTNTIGGTAKYNQLDGNTPTKDEVEEAVGLLSDNGDNVEKDHDNDNADVTAVEMAIMTDVIDQTDKDIRK